MILDINIFFLKFKVMNHSEVTINKVTKLNQNHDENITWSKIIKKEKKALIRRGYGEPPLAMVCSYMHFINHNYFNFPHDL